MYVCICQAITDRQIKSAVEGGISSVEELKETLGVAVCCGSCEQDAEKIVAEHCRVAGPRIYQPGSTATEALSGT
ncbi:MAG: (2Fe-2S)-binding protein [Pseudomonadota bacterium]